MSSIMLLIVACIQKNVTYIIGTVNKVLEWYVHKVVSTTSKSKFLKQVFLNPPTINPL